MKPIRAVATFAVSVLMLPLFSPIAASDELSVPTIPLDSDSGGVERLIDEQPTPDLARGYQNVIDRTGSPEAFRMFDSTGNQVFNPLLDQGAWHGFTLPAETSEYGGFTGPMVISEEYSLFFAHELDKLSITSGGEPVDFANAKAKEIHEIPAALIQRFDFEEFGLE